MVGREGAAVVVRWAHAAAALVLAALSLAATGPQSAQVVLLKFADHAEEPCTAAYAGDIVFNQYGPWLAAESRGREWLTGTVAANVWGWLTLPHPVSYYNCPIGIYGTPALTGCSAALWDDAAATAAPYFNPYAAGLVVFVYNYGVGSAAGSPTVHTNCNAPPGVSQLSLPMLKHEGGHAQPERLYHAARWTCPGEDVGPDLDNLLAGGCNWTSYGDPYDPMGGGYQSGHYSTYMRGRLGWLAPSNVRTVSTSEEVSIRRADVDSDEVQELRVTSGEDYYYTLEYRPDVGGVLVRHHGRYSYSDAETFLVNQFGWPLAFGDSFVDPYRAIMVSLVSEDGERAVVQVERGGGGAGGGSTDCRGRLCGR